MKKFCLFWFSLCSLTLSAQAFQPAGSFDGAVANIERQLRMFPQEKVYLHTDKPYYITGEKVFFRAHLVDAASNAPAYYSRYVYVELVNPLDSVVSRLKVRPEDGAYYGQIGLPEEMPEGVYKIRAYTNFMRNVGEAYFFTRTVRIGDPNSLSIQTEVEYAFEEAKKVVMTLRFVDLKQQEYLKPQSITVRLNRGKTVRTRPDKEGLVRLKLDLPADASERVAYIEADVGRLYKQYLRIPYPGDDYEVSFFPEGGRLVVGSLCNVAFKALKATGLPEEIEGELFNQRGEALAAFSSAGRGLGSFFIHSLSTEDVYYAVCRNKAGLEKRFDLPSAVEDAPALRLRVARDKIWVIVNKPKRMEKDTVYLVVHSRGIVQYADRWDDEKELLAFDSKNFPSGIVNFLLLSPDRLPLSERLAFVRNEDHALVSFRTAKPAYKGREKVEAAIEVKDVFGQPLAGSFSLSVTDDREVEVDTCFSLYDNLLLTSELKGYIDCPACYLKDDKMSMMLLDMLLMTHGWRRYDIPKAARGEFAVLSEALERGQEISGMVKGGLFSKPSEGAKVTVFSPERQFIDIAETGKDGRFYLRGFEFPDSTRYVVHSTSRRGRKTVELIVDQESFPLSTSPWIDASSENDRVFLDYVAKADRQYTYENGVRLIRLDEVTVKGRRKKTDELRRSSLYGEADNTLTEEEIERSGFGSVRNMLYRFPGVQVGPDYIRVRGSSGDPLLLVDNIEMDIEMLDDLNLYDIAQIDLLKSGHNLALFGSRGGNGVISVFTKTGKPTFRDNLLNIVVYAPLGYHTPVEFYAPRYDTLEKMKSETPDLRSTLYWSPDIKTDRSTGLALLDFYTADADRTSYTVTIEGVSEDGKIVRCQRKIKRE